MHQSETKNTAHVYFWSEFILKNSSTSASPFVIVSWGTKLKEKGGLYLRIAMNILSMLTWLVFYLSVWAIFLKFEASFVITIYKICGLF